MVGYAELVGFLIPKEFIMKSGIPAKDMGDELAAQGRFGDTIIAHISPREAAMLKMMGGSGSINPKTGILEFWGEGGSDPDSSADDDGADVAGDSSMGGGDMGGGGWGYGGSDPDSSSVDDGGFLGGVEGVADTEDEGFFSSMYSSFVSGLNTFFDDPIGSIASVPGAISRGLMKVAEDPFGYAFDIAKNTVAKGGLMALGLPGLAAQGAIIGGNYLAGKAGFNLRDTVSNLNTGTFSEIESGIPSGTQTGGTSLASNSFDTSSANTPMSLSTRSIIPSYNPSRNQYQSLTGLKG